MPRYDYACTACDHRFEAVQSFSDAPLTECPGCGGRLRKLISPVGVVFKGSGFYRNDSRPKETAAASGDGGSAKSASKADSNSGGSAGGSDATPATKTDSTSAAKSESKTSAAAGSDSSTATKSA